MARAARSRSARSRSFSACVRPCRMRLISACFAFSSRCFFFRNRFRLTTLLAMDLSATRERELRAGDDHPELDAAAFGLDLVPERGRAGGDVAAVGVLRAIGDERDLAVRD